ncbi:hypothetical protein ACINWC136_A0082 [Acinetobacter pittii]|uniref:hypothetical protein n=1 Tax=Acinetobacter pittii TaxID=48296 RepID=UPI00029E6C4C|nr:hypothetical protein [Acinetobacter pittii]EKU68524.1 hypothetical protein ACINWC136_A0082 [Acinetobacter pittii]
MPIYEKQDFSNIGFEIGYVINSDGTRSNTSDSTWHNYYVDVKKGDVINLFCTTGDSTTNLTMSFIAQLDEDKAFIKNLKTFKTTGFPYNIASGTVVAEQDGHIYIRARVGIAPKITRTRANFLQHSDFDMLYDSKAQRLKT